MTTRPQVSDGEWKGSVVVPDETRDEILLRRLRAREAREREACRVCTPDEQQEGRGSND